jgi:hypothetical protein
MWCESIGVKAENIYLPKGYKHKLFATNRHDDPVVPPPDPAPNENKPESESGEALNVGTEENPGDEEPPQNIKTNDGKGFLGKLKDKIS